MKTDDELQSLWRTDAAPPAPEGRYPMFTPLEDRMILNKFNEGPETGPTRFIALAALIALVLVSIQNCLQGSDRLDLAGNILILFAPMEPLIREFRLRKRSLSWNYATATAEYWQHLLQVYQQRDRDNRRSTIWFCCAAATGFVLILMSAILRRTQVGEVNSGAVVEAVFYAAALIGAFLFIGIRRRHTREILETLADEERALEP